MEKTSLTVQDVSGENVEAPLTWVHTLVIGSGAAGLNAAAQLRACGVEDVRVVSEGLEMGTSINTGSDKQTYYKLSLCGEDTDSPVELARMYYANGGMHGDLALVEASLSPRAFLNLVNMGVPFPRDAYGQFVGYKTDHDPRQRATSIGPYTSREMCRALIREVQRLNIPVLEQRQVVELIDLPAADGGRRVAGAIAVAADGAFEAFGAENVVFATGGPGGLYKTSVYPNVHTGGIGLALRLGARAQNLAESQYGMASIKFRWNVSGTYMQVVPRFISTAADGESDAREFLPEWFDSAGEMNSMVFLKGYQWPFDSRKVVGGSSLIDICVYMETALKGRRVFLDFRRNPSDFSFDALSDEAREYLEKSGALLDTPIERLRAMNPAAIELYRDHGIDIAAEPLEIAVCAQHNNGGLAGNHWWESVNIAHLFPIGEVNGSHGVYRPGGSALNAGQVGAFRAAEYIAGRYREWSLPRDEARRALTQGLESVLAWLGRSQNADTTWPEEREAFQQRMTRFGAHIRTREKLEEAAAAAWAQWQRMEQQGCACRDAADRAEALRNRQLCFAHAVYLDATLAAVRDGVGSRGSAIVLDAQGAPVHDRFDDTWRAMPEETGFREKVMETEVHPEGRTETRWVPRRPIPESDLWFETAWAKFRNGEIYDG